jgi:hypothetical protein
MCFHLGYIVCPPDTVFHYNSVALFNLTETNWAYFYVAILDGANPLRLRINSKGSFTIYVGNSSSCPDFESIILVKSTQTRFRGEKHFLPTESNYIQSFGVHSSVDTEIRIDVRDPGKIVRKFSNSRGMALLSIGVIIFVCLFGRGIHELKNRS